MIKFNIIISTQIHENYGAHDWDGTGQCPQYWKAKGGNEYRHPIALDLSEVQDRSKVSVIVKELTNSVVRDNDFYQETSLDWYFLPVGDLTSEEKRQVEWYGSVKNPTPAPRNLQLACAA